MLVECEACGHPFENFEHLSCPMCGWRDEWLDAPLTDEEQEAVDRGLEIYPGPREGGDR